MLKQGAPVQQQTPSQTRILETPTDVHSGSKSEHEDMETESDDDRKSSKTGKQNQHTEPSKKPRGMGSSHKAGSVKSYSLWMRIGMTQDIRVGGMVMKAVLEKWNAICTGCSLRPRIYTLQTHVCSDTWNSLKIGHQGLRM